MNRKVALALGGIVLLGAVLLGGIVYLSTPRTAQAQLERARRLERAAQAAPPEVREVAIGEAVAAFDRVADFPDERGAHEDALRDAAGLLARERRFADAEARVRKLLARTPPPADAGALRLRLGEWREQAKDWEGARKAYLELALADKAAKEADEAAFRAAVLLEERIEGIAPAEVIGSYERFVADFPKSKHAPEALWRLAAIYRKVGEKERAVALYRKLADEYPQSEEAARALREIGLIYGDELKKPAEAAKALKELEEKHPGSPSARGAGALRKKAEKEAAEKDDEEYEESHYGGRVADMGDLIPPTPREALAELIATKLDVRRVVVDATIDAAVGQLAVAVTLTVAHEGARPRKDLLLTLPSFFHIEAATFDGEKVETEHEASTLRVKLAKEWAPGEARALEVRYAGTVPPEAGIVRIGAEGGFGIGSGGWLPGGAIGDLFTCETTLHAPDGLEVVATGTGGREPDGSWRYASDLPIFGVYFAYGKWKTVRGEWRGRPISVHSLTEGFDRGAAFLEEARAILDFYTEHYGDMPWPKLAIVEADLPGFIAGVGPASMLLLERGAFQRDGVPENLMAHELAHQWWGNAVPATLAEGYAPWLSEGLATYSDALYFESRHGAAEARKHLTKYAHLYYEIVLHAPDQALDDAWMTGPAYRAIAYEKAARTLHMLRYALGDEAFFKGMRLYGERNRFKQSTTASLREALEAASGADLKGFFEDWTKRPGFPRLALAAVRAARGEGGRFAVECLVRQEKDVYRIPAIELRFDGPAGEKESRRVALSKAEETFRFDLQFAPVSAALDPDDDVLKPPTRETEWSPAIAEERARRRGGGAVGQAAPRLRAQDLDGNAVDLDALRGSVVLLDFYATWCGPCRRTSPDLTALARELGPRGLRVFGVSREDAETQRAFAREAGVGYPLLLGDEAIEADFGGVKAVPTLFVIDRNGVVKVVHVGAMAKAELAAEVAGLLDAPPEAESRTPAR